MEKHIHHVYKDCSISLALFSDVQNAEEIKQSVMNGELEATLLNTQMISDPFQVLVAANRAVHLQRAGKMTTKNVHSEVLFCLSPTKNISESFKKFGMSDSDQSVFVVLINDKDDKMMNMIESRIQGTLESLKDIKGLTNEGLIQKTYKVTDEELKSCSLTNVLLSKISSKAFVTA